MARRKPDGSEFTAADWKRWRAWMSESYAREGSLRLMVTSRSHPHWHEHQEDQASA